MRLAYLDGSAGVSGDMLLGALIHAGAPLEALHATLRSLSLHAELDVEQVDRCGIAATHARILTNGRPADETPQQHHQAHHEPHRSLADIRTLILAADLPPAVTDRAIRAFTLLGEAEAKVHGVPLEKVHFHEVGAVDAIADIVLVAAAAHVLAITAWRSGPLNVGSGTVQCAHGRFPVPAPATAELLRGSPTYSSGHEGELVTPTGAALLRAFETEFGAQPPMIADSMGYGAGSRNPAGMANVARLTLGEAESSADSAQTVVVLETALDDCSPQVIAHFAEEALRLGALDVLRTPVFMKKNRTGTLLTVLVDRARAAAIEQLLLRETSTLGLRIREERRVCLDRRVAEVTTEWGSVRVKVGLRGGEEMNAAPEFEDCRRLAEANAVPLKLVMEAALRAYRNGKP
jgi:uncharacterized protein (TIGR00299 family) protein